MIRTFFNPTEIVFGNGTIQEIKRFVRQDQQILVITGKTLTRLGAVDRLLNELRSAGASPRVYNDIQTNPDAATVQLTLEYARKVKPDLIVAFGGGSPIDVAKAVSLLLTNPEDLNAYLWDRKPLENLPVPLIAIPTTAGTGSEVTRTAVIVDRNEKAGLVRDELFPRAAIIDPELMITMPPSITAFTGMDALTHAIETYIGKGANMMTDALAMEAIRILFNFLPKAYADGTNLDARGKVAIASTMAGAAMAQGGLGFVHAMSSPLGSVYDVPHGLSNAVLLSHGLEFNLPYATEKIANIARALGETDDSQSDMELAISAVKGLKQLIKELQIPSNLSDYYQNEEDIQRFANEAKEMFLMRNNPRAPEVEDCARTFRAVLLG